ncbi:MAG: hypothetical protein R3174_05735 [Gammaproteobacteria bacterium]|nr:hypothetical protein [Gammaproteobacteria bacterium]
MAKDELKPMHQSLLTVTQTVVWVIAGTAILRLWHSPHDWLVWTLIPLLIFEMGVSATLKRVAQGDSVMVESEEEKETFRLVWVKVHGIVCLAAAGLGVYGHTLV